MGFARFRLPALPGPRQAGFSLLESVVLVGVIGAAAMAISRVSLNEQVARSKLKSSVSHRDAFAGFQSGVSEGFKKFLDDAGRCEDKNMKKLLRDVAKHFDGIRLTQPTGKGKNAPRSSAISYVTKISGKLSSDLHKEAAERCRRPRAASDSLYFCIEMSADTSAPKDSFLNHGGVAFAEIYARTLNYESRRAVSCAGYDPNIKVIGGGDRSVNVPFGLDIWYALHWDMKAAKGSGLQVNSVTKTGQFYTSGGPK